MPSKPIARDAWPQRRQAVSVAYVAVNRVDCLHVSSVSRIDHPFARIQRFRALWTSSATPRSAV